MTDQHKEAGYYTQRPSKKQRDADKGRTALDSILEELERKPVDAYREGGIVEGVNNESEK
jgi:hypothetical protein